MKINEYKNVLVIDLETSGLSPIKDTIIEVGYILFENKDNFFEKIKGESFLINSTDYLDPRIETLTGISLSDIKESGITVDKAIIELDKILLDKTLVVGYNLNFDYSFLYQLYTKNNLEYKDLDCLDLMTVYKDHYPYPHKLESAANNLGLERGLAHRALGDCETTYNLLVALFENIDASSYINYFGYNPKYSIPYCYNKNVVLVAQRYMLDVSKYIDSLKNDK
ncbi:MAG: 3'-5' exonuclease [Acholeplasmatales bacterium]|jgi:DNA polymerase III alpha subunit (gram-positive type)|nr:3'-5' exonuclease [Acholeplasmatales bacterium]